MGLFHKLWRTVSRWSKLSFQNEFLRGFVNRVGLSKCPRSYAQGPNLAEHQGAVSRCSRAAVDEQFVDVPKIVQFADSPALQVVEEPVFKISPRTGFDSVLLSRRPKIRFPMFPCRKWWSSWEKCRRRCLRNRIQRRTAELIGGMPVFKDYSQDRVQQRFVEQNIENPVDESTSQIMEERVEVVTTVFQERISERICYQGGVISPHEQELQLTALQMAEMLCLNAQ